MKICVLLLLLLSCGRVSAQNREIVEAVSGEDLSPKVSYQMQFVFPEFRNGEVVFVGVPRIGGVFNYNILIGEMQFIDNEQVLALANMNRVLFVSIDDRIFYPFNSREFTEELYSIGNIFLRVRYRGRAARHTQRGAYGMETSTASITSYSSLLADSRAHELTIPENVVITVNNIYYLVESNGKHKQIRNKRTFTRQFPMYKSQINSFVNENKIRFNNPNDLIAMFQFIDGLSN